MKVRVHRPGTLKHDDELINVEASTEVQEFEEGFAKKLIEFEYATLVIEEINIDKKELLGKAQETLAEASAELLERVPAKEEILEDTPELAKEEKEEKICDVQEKSTSGQKRSRYSRNN